MMYMEGQYDRNGKLCAIITEVGKTFLVDMSPLAILEDSIKSIGFDLKGAMKTSKWFHGDIHMRPLMVNPIQGICLFPSKSAKNEDTMWFNPYHIKRTSGYNRKTFIEFSNGLTIEVQSILSSFNHKLQIAEQFRNMTVETGKNPISFVLDPKERRIPIKS
jgi:competence protein ComK